MFKEKTVLVLGAGASVHAGFPIGEELIFNIMYKLDSATYYRNGHDLEKLTKVFPEANNLLQALEFYDPLSVDNFLTQHGNAQNKIQEIGKTLIAWVLLEREDAGKLISHRNHLERQNCNWYRYLWHAIVSGGQPDAIIRNVRDNLKIITFNYDVSLDYYLLSRIIDQNSFFDSQSKKEFFNIINDITFHVYGQIRKFEWDDNLLNGESLKYGWKNLTSEFERDRNQNLAFERAKEYSFNIKVISESERVEGAETAVSWLNDAKNIFFLGYGFHDENNDLLNLKEIRRDISNNVNSKRIFVTNKGNSKIILSKIKKFFEFYPDGQPIFHVMDNTVYEALERDFDLLQDMGMKN